MKRFSYLLVILCLMVVGLRSARAQNHDFGLWVSLGYKHDFKDSPFTLIWATESRFDQDASHYQLFNTTLGFTYRISDWFKTGLSYRFERVWDKSSENRIMPEAIFSYRYGAMRFEDKNTFENRIFSDSYRFRYRNRIKLGPKFQAAAVSFHPFVSNEVFIEARSGSGGGFNQNRFIVGNTFGFSGDRIEFTPYFLMKSDRESEGWVSAFILGTGLEFHY